MIRVRIKREAAGDAGEPVITGFTVSGHAFFNDAGKDIICAAVSMITINTVNAFEEFLPDARLSASVDRKKGMIDVRLEGERDERSDILLETFRLGVMTLEQKYGSKFVSVAEDQTSAEFYKEVTKC